MLEQGLRLSKASEIHSRAPTSTFALFRKFGGLTPLAHDELACHVLAIRLAIRIRDMKSFIKILCLTLGLMSLTTISGGCRSAYYAAYEKFGVYKRDLLKKNVVAARDEQKEASEQFKDALTRLKELYGFSGGNLEKTYRSLQSEYDDCAAKADDVHKRIREVETVASDLFAEWEKEIQEISTPSLASSSRRTLQATRERYENLHKALKDAEDSMNPVLTQLHDHVLYLKHNLNAEAIASLKGEAVSIQTDISKLIAQMNAAIAKADEFVKTLQSE